MAASRSSSESDSDSDAGNPLATTPNQTVPDGGPADITEIPDQLVAEPDDCIRQSAVLENIIGTTLQDSDADSIDRFNKKRVYPLNLSELKTLYERQDRRKALNLLLRRNTIKIDDHFRLEAGNGELIMQTNRTMLDFHLTVADRIGLSTIIPKHSNHHFVFDMDLKKPYRDFKGKYAMVGFDTKAKMLYIGKAMNEDIFLAMAPREFLSSNTGHSPPGHSTGPSLLSRRHYRQVVMMMAHFLQDIPDRSYSNIRDVYSQDLDAEEPNWVKVTNALEDEIIRLNFEEVKTLDRLIVSGYSAWARDAPQHWKADGFLEKHCPILVTSRYGQDVAIATPDNGAQAAQNWDLERDYAKVAYLTFALATSIECSQVFWRTIPNETLKRKHPDGIFVNECPNRRRRVDVDDIPLLDPRGHEIPIFDSEGEAIRRRDPVKDSEDPPCGVLMNLENIHALFNPNREYPLDSEDSSTDYDHLDPQFVHVDAYPLGFLRVAGNVQAKGIPQCFYPVLTKINQSTRKDLNETTDGDSDAWHGDQEDISSYSMRRARVVRPVASQFYNYISHRVASRAGGFDAQQGTVTAALAGAFAQTVKDRATAHKKQDYCDDALPSERKCQILDSDISKRKASVPHILIHYGSHTRRRSIYKDIILPLCKAWKRSDVRNVVKDHLVILKTEAFPNLYDWVAYPVTVLIDELYKHEMANLRKDETVPCHMRLELLASLERVLCFCHTGNTAVFATSLMHRLGLSKGSIMDGFPMLLMPLFEQRTISSAMEHGFKIDARHWPLKDKYPAIASKRAQVLTYSIRHFHAYQATFRIQHALIVNPTSSYPGLESTYENRAMCIVEIALMALVDDVKQLVEEGVRRDIVCRISQARSEEDRQAAVLRGGEREKFLEIWLRSERPLTYGEPGHFVAFQALIQAVVAAPEEISSGLPNFNGHAMTPTDFVGQLLRVRMSSSISPSSPGAPVMTKGAFLPLLLEAHRNLIILSQQSDKDAQRSFVQGIFLRALRHLQISFVPSHRPRSGTRGAPYEKPVFDSWASLGRRDDQPLLSIPQPHDPPSTSQHSAAIALADALAGDSNAEWFVNKITIHSLRTVLQKSRLPQDFITPKLSDIAYVDQTYSWVRNTYDGTKQVHHLALIIGVIAASLIPDLFMPDDTPRRPFLSASREKVRRIYAGIDWVRKGRKGLSDKSIFIAMFTTFIIAVYEPDSPLHLHMMSSSRKGLGEGWTNKHTPKGITYTALIRLGICWGEGSGAFEKGTFGTHWGCHGPEYIDKLYTSLLSKLGTQGNYGPFDALTILIGDRNARLFCQRRLKLASRPPS
ncbi:hypothetical protein EDB84DRAFT_1566372 [Lactarius hengduanensis]|nr:hypothetical protein EDB84DRAFT_1566372 [Lactarius hengduanensis]